MSVKELERVNFRGEPVTRRQRAATLYTERDPKIPFLFVVPQGSWQPETSYSGTTHTNAGVEDLYFDGIGDNEKTRITLRALRDDGKQAAFLRGPRPNLGNFSMWHFHVCDLDTRGMDPNAIWQVSQYKLGCDGLKAGFKDPFPYRPENFRPFNFDAWVKYLETNHDLKKLVDRIDAKVETLEDLREQRDHLKNIIRRQLNERIA